MATETRKPDTTHTDFAKFLAELNKGGAVLELSQALEEVVKAVRDTGRPGKLVYQLVIKPVGNNGVDVDQVTVDDSIAMKLPQRKRKASLFFTTAKNTLQRNNPGQRDFLEEQQQGQQ